MMDAAGMRGTVRRSCVRHLIERVARRVHRRRRGLPASVSCAADGHVGHLHERLDACMERIAVLEMAVFDRSACADRRLRAVEDELARTLAVVERVMRSG